VLKNKYTLPDGTKITGTMANGILGVDNGDKGKFRMSWVTLTTLKKLKEAGFIQLKVTKPKGQRYPNRFVKITTKGEKAGDYLRDVEEIEQIEKRIHSIKMSLPEYQIAVLEKQKAKLAKKLKV